MMIHNWITARHHHQPPPPMATLIISSRSYSSMIAVFAAHYNPTRKTLYWSDGTVDPVIFLWYLYLVLWWDGRAITTCPLTPLPPKNNCRTKPAKEEEEKEGMMPSYCCC
jgi:hypothetical protein